MCSRTSAGSEENETMVDGVEDQLGAWRIDRNFKLHLPQSACVRLLDNRTCDANLFFITTCVE